MVALDGIRLARYELVTAGYHFLLAAIPLRHPESRHALAGFIRDAAESRLGPAEREAVVIHALAVLDPHTGGRLPSLVDRYLALRSVLPDCVRRFERCVEDVLRYRGIGNPHVQEALAIVHESYREPGLREESIAQAVDVSPSHLCSAIRAATGFTLTHYLRGVRLDHAARTLIESHKSVKQVAADVGYADVPRLCRDFKERFGLTPTEYRARGIRPAPEPSSAGQVPQLGRSGALANRRILIVDDDQGTRDTCGLYFRRAGCVTELASTGREGLDRALATRPDVMVLDVHLPDMDGVACLRELRRRRPGRHPPVLLFTADWDFLTQAEEAHALGAALLSKLCDLQEIGRVVASLCTMCGRPPHRDGAR